MIIKRLQYIYNIIMEGSTFSRVLPIETIKFNIMFNII